MTIAALVASALLLQAPIAVQGAVDTELKPLIEAVGNPEPVDIQGFRFWEGEIDGTRVVVSRTEVGMVHAAMATTILIREYAPRIIINQGTAGAVNPELRRGDIVLAEASVPFGAFRTSQRKRDEGVDIERWTVLPRLLREGDERVRFESFTTDPELLARASEVPYAGGELFRGVVGSADQWNREIDKLLWAHEVFGIDSEDMETAAVHQVAYISGIPVLAVRIISNSEYHDEEFRPELGSDCAEFVIAVVKALAR
jgi:adenosylhomocysteine nucleosidase